ncbi:hypothetical protein RRF57_008470 [Xylaria bambusicola]|uniref:Uncharacterized protein n=1 Tax=Xylaria bambusicola TaxID=326684 RepID=A0AAN7UVE2_9PEZI
MDEKTQPTSPPAPTTLLISKGIAEPSEQARRRHVAASVGLAAAFLADGPVEGSRARQVKAAADVITRSVGVDGVEGVHPEDRDKGYEHD